MRQGHTHPAPVPHDPLRHRSMKGRAHSDGGVGERVRFGTPMDEERGRKRLRDTNIPFRATPHPKRGIKRSREDDTRAALADAHQRFMAAMVEAADEADSVQQSGADVMDTVDVDDMQDVDTNAR